MAFWQLSSGRPDSPALLDGTAGVVAYRDLAAAAESWSARLSGLPGRTLGLVLFPPSVEAIALYLACLRARRHVPALLADDLHPDLLARLAASYRPEWIAAPATLPTLAGYARVALEGEFALQLRDGGGDATPPHDELALLLSTSGSTGSQKFVRLSNRAIDSNAAAIAEYLRLTADDRAITTLPLAYSFGMSILNSHLAVGGSLVLTRLTLMSKEFWQLADASGITSLSGVPSTFEMLRRLAPEKRALPRLRMLTQAGGRLRPELVAEFERKARARGWQMVVMYGQTEASPRISYVPPERLAEKTGSIGVAIPGGRIRIDAESSELVYEGPNVMMGYATSRADLALGDTLGGVLRTGDLARLDDEGYAYITGRLNRFVKLSGVRTSLDEVEQILAGRFAASVACVGADDRLAVFLAAASAPSDNDLRGHLRDMMNVYPGLVDVRRLEALPLMANGKIDYAALRRLAEDKAGANS
jgi:acyl-CoA synthetase (AMP-forming)/AMP-acid ligase II